jgi:hypothetical protein
MLAVVAWLGRLFANHLPEATGLVGWVWAIVAGAAPALTVLALLTATGFLPFAELQALLRRAPVGRSS